MNLCDNLSSHINYKSINHFLMLNQINLSQEVADFPKHKSKAES